MSDQPDPLAWASAYGLSIVCDHMGVLPFEQPLPEGMSGPRKLVNVVHVAPVQKYGLEVPGYLLVTREIYEALERACTQPIERVSTTIKVRT